MGLFGKSLESSGDFSMRCQCLTSSLVRRCVGRCGEYVVVKVRRSPAACGLLARVFCLSGNLIPFMLSSMVSCILFFSYFRHASLCACVRNVASFEFVRRYLSSSPLMIPRPVPGGWADEACTYCWVLVGLIWVLMSRMPSLANLSPLYKHRSKNVISSVENSAVKLMRWCRSLMLSMNCSRLSSVSVHTKNISSMYLFQCMGEGVVSERILDSSAPIKMLA